MILRSRRAILVPYAKSASFFEADGGSPRGEVRVDASAKRSHDSVSKNLIIAPSHSYYTVGAGTYLNVCNYPIRSDENRRGTGRRGVRRKCGPAAWT